MKHKYTYKVIEDNGGGLTLYVFWGRWPIYTASGYEYRPGALVDDLNVLDAGTDIDLWEPDQDLDPRSSWEELQGYEYGWEIVVSGGRGKRNLYKHRMGAAAMLEFGVTQEEHDAAQSAAYLGGIKSERKAKAARENGKKGGRPRKKSK